MNIIAFSSPEKRNRKQAARVSDTRYYALLNLAIHTYKTFSKSLTVSG